MHKYSASGTPTHPLKAISHHIFHTREYFLYGEEHRIYLCNISVFIIIEKSKRKCLNDQKGIFSADSIINHLNGDQQGKVNVVWHNQWPQTTILVIKLCYVFHSQPWACCSPVIKRRGIRYDRNWPFGTLDVPLKTGQTNTGQTNMCPKHKIRKLVLTLHAVIEII